MRELPAAAITTSSESVFITLSVCATAMIRAKGMTIGMIDGRISVAISKKVKADWPLSVTRSMRASTCVVQTIASVQNSAAAKTSSVRRRYVAFDDLHESAIPFRRRLSCRGPFRAAGYGANYPPEQREHNRLELVSVPSSIFRHAQIVRDYWIRKCQRRMVNGVLTAIRCPAIRKRRRDLCAANCEQNAGAMALALPNAAKRPNVAHHDCRIPESRNP